MDEILQHFETMGNHLIYLRYLQGNHYSSTAESFGVSAQIGSGVVRGGPEVRFHEGSTRVPPGFHQGSTRVAPGSARAAGGPGWFEVRFHEGSTGFHQFLQELRGGPGEVRFHEGSRLHQGSTRVPPGFHQGSTRVPPGSSRAGVGLQGGWATRVPPGFHQGSTRVPPGFHQGCTRFCEGCGWSGVV